LFFSFTPFQYRGDFLVLTGFLKHTHPFSQTLMLVQIEKIDIITARMGNALTTEGGFCTGSVRVADHQVDANTMLMAHRFLI
jgi:7-keto-8-aminopelargonate synthetase-like enzyme